MKSNVRPIAQQIVIVSLDLSLDPQAKQFIKTGSVSVTFAQEAGRIATHEGEVGYFSGDALITGVGGECWPVTRHSAGSAQTA